MKGMIKAITRTRRSAGMSGGRRNGRAKKRDSRGRFKASAASRMTSVFRSRGGKPSAAAKQRTKREDRDRRPEYSVDVRADVRTGRMKPERAEDDYTRIVNDGFDRREISVINRSGGVDLIVQNTRNEYAAHYGGKNRKGRHNVTVDPMYVHDPETVTHETVHILQEVDQDRPELDKILSVKKKGGLTVEDRSLKEALTEAETIARVKDPKISQVPFYHSIDAEKAAEMKRADTDLIKAGMKGRSKGESVVVVHSLFDRLHISKYRHSQEGRLSDRTAKEQRDHIEEIGT